MSHRSMTVEYTDAWSIASRRDLHEQQPYCRRALYDVAIVGLGYVGLPTAIGFAQAVLDATYRASALSQRALI